MAKIGEHGEEKIAAYVCRVTKHGANFKKTGTNSFALVKDEEVTMHFVLTSLRLLVSHNGRKSYSVSKEMKSAEMLENYSYRLENTCERLAR